MENKDNGMIHFEKISKNEAPLYRTKIGNKYADVIQLGLGLTDTEAVRIKNGTPGTVASLKYQIKKHDYPLRVIERTLNGAKEIYIVKSDGNS